MDTGNKLTIKGRQKRIDKEELIRLCLTRKPDGQKYTHAEMANELGVSRISVTKAIQKIPKSMLVEKDLEYFREQRADIFAELQRTVLAYLTPQKMKKASLQQLGNLFKMLYESEKLELGQATEHIAVIHKNQLDNKSLKLIEEAIKSATEKKLEEARQESLALSGAKDLVKVN